MMFEAPIVVSEGDLEQEYRHLHHADICKLLERGRLLYLEAIGCPQEYLIANDCFLVLSRMNLEFSREIKAEQLIVTCKASIREDGLVEIEQQLLKHPRRLCVSAKLELACIGGKSRRKRELPESLRAAIGLDCN